MAVTKAACSSGGGDGDPAARARAVSDRFTFAVVGDYPYIPDDVTAEAAARGAAGQTWVRAGFEAAVSAGSKGIVIFFQADPNLDLYRLGVRNAHTDLLRTFEREAILYQRPVLLVHGDTHVFRVDMALVGSGDGRPIENVTRLENFGERDVHWSRVTVDPAGPELFTFSPGIVAGNRAQHPAPR